MSKNKNQNTATSTQTKPPPPPPIDPDTIEPIFELYGMGVYLTTKEHTMEVLKKKSEPIFFVLSNKRIKGAKPTDDIVKPSLFKIVNAEFANFVVEVPLSTLGMVGEVSERASFELPNLSWEFVLKMEHFFRSAHEKLGTESIIMLTYDRSFFENDDPTLGWDFYVPTQENSAHSCDYKMAEIASHLEDNPNLILAGSAHSHPEMHAYFSGTDHKDQADWDGLHITFGWLKNAPIEYHIELVAGGKQWNLEPHQIFEMPPVPKVEFDFEDQLKKVSKPAPKQALYGYGTSYDKSGHQTWGGTKPQNLKNHGPQKKGPSIHLPTNAPNPKENTIVATMVEEDTDCLFCYAPLTPKTLEHNRCYACGNFFLYNEMTIDDLIDKRNKAELPDFDLLDYTNEKASVWIWHKKTVNEKTVNAFLKVDSKGELDESKKG